MAERNLAVRLAVIDSGKVRAELRDAGERGERALIRAPRINPQEYAPARGEG